MSFHKTYSHLVVIWNWRNTYFYTGLCIPTHLYIQYIHTLYLCVYTVYIHTYIMCVYRDLHICLQDWWQGNAENDLWLALLLFSAKGSSSMLRWSCKFSWKWVSFAVSFPSSLDLYLTKVLAFALCKWVLMRSLNFDNHPFMWHALDNAVSRFWGEAVFQLWTTNSLKSDHALLGRRIVQWGWLGICLTGD